MTSDHQYNSPSDHSHEAIALERGESVRRRPGLFTKKVNAFRVAGTKVVLDDYSLFGDVNLLIEPALIVVGNSESDSRRWRGV